jgi:hypothetical protein
MRVQDSWVPVSLLEVGIGFSGGEYLLYGGHQIVEAERLVEYCATRQLWRPVGLRGHWISAHQDYPVQHPRPAPHDCQKESITGHLGEAEIQEHQIKDGFSEDLIRRVGIGDGENFVPVTLEGALQGAS